MSIKFKRSSNQYLSIPDSAALTFPKDSTWTQAFIVVFDGLVSGDNTQYFVSTGSFGSPGSYNVVFYPINNPSASIPGRICVYCDSAQVVDFSVQSSVDFTAGAYLIVIQHAADNTLSMRHCPILSVQPTDASAVVASASSGRVTALALDGPSGLRIGGRTDGAANRASDQSLARVFYMPGVLTDIEVANLAYGKELTDIGKTANWYFRLDTTTDIADRGTQGNVATANSTLTLGTAPGFGYTSGGTTPVAAAIDAAQLVAEVVYQRLGGAAIVGLSGTWAGSTQPTTIEYQLYAPDGATVQKVWSTVGATISGSGTWSASPSIPQPTNGKKYLIQYRSKDSGGTVLATSAVKSNRFAVGDIIGFIGSSSAEKAFQADSGSGFPADPDATSMYDGSWKVIGTTGCAVLIASSLAAQAGVPVALLNYGIGGSTLGDWNAVGYGRWDLFAAAVGAVGGKLGATLVTVGSNDAAYGQVASRASHAANLRSLFTRVRTLTGQVALPICTIGFNRRTSYSATAAQYALCANYVRMAENDVGDDVGICAVQTLDFLLSSDGIHLASVDAGYPAWGRRAAYQFGAFLNGTYLRGPKQTQIAVSGVTTVHTLMHRGSTDFTPTSGITGFTATDPSSAAIALVSSVRTNVTTITNTWASAPAKVQYLEGGAPAVGTPVFGNTATALPMTVETDMVVVQAAQPASAEPLGVTAIASVGTAIATGGAVASPSGVSATASVGQAAATGGGAGVAAPAGVAAAASVGTASASGGAIAAPAGVIASASVGTVTASAGSSAVASPAGLAAQSSVGQAVAAGGAIAQPAGVGAQASIGQVIASGSISIGATAMPLGVSAFARVGVAVATGGVTYARAPEGPGYSPRSRCFSSRPPASQGNCS